MGLKAIGINIYGGGFTLGVMKHFEVLGQWEECKLGMKTFDMNFKEIYRPLELNQWPVEAYSGDVDFVYANPPCTPWSTSTGLKGATIHNRKYDRRLELTAHTMEAALELKPKVFISESVENAYNIGSNYYDQFKELWMNSGYSVTYFLNDAILQSCPSKRRRFHFIAHKNRLQLELPKLKIKTVKDVLKDLVDVEKIKIPDHFIRNIHPSVLAIAHQVPENGLIRETIKTIKDYKGTKMTFWARKLAWNWPAPTMVRFDLLHPTNRWITHREALRLCSYPDSFKIYKPEEAIDAVLPIVAEFLALTAKKTILKAEGQEKTFQVIDWRPLAKPYHFKKNEFNE